MAFSSEVDAGSREENASNKLVAFSSEVGTGSREENASNKMVAFSSEVGTGSREENASNKRVFETGNPMCLLCDDEKAYAAYMNYLDAMQRQGKLADPDKAMDAVLDQLEAADKANKNSDDPANDKTLSPFFCSPVDK